MIATCPVLVTRSTGHAPTPFTRASGRVRCGRPTTWALIGVESGSCHDFACNRHKPNLERVMPDEGFVILPIEKVKS